MSDKKSTFQDLFGVVKEELKDSNLKYKAHYKTETIISTVFRLLVYVEPGHRIVTWKPGAVSNNTAATKTYFVYIPAQVYRFDIQRHHEASKISGYLRSTWFCLGTNPGQRKKVLSPIPNGSCLGVHMNKHVGYNYKYDYQNNKITTVMNDYWNYGLNLDNINQSKFLKRLALRYKLAVKSHALFEKWENISNEEVEYLLQGTNPLHNQPQVASQSEQ